MRALLRAVVFLAVWLSAAAAWAGQRVALVFSAEAYEFLRPLKNPGKDADSVAETLKGLGFKVFAESDRDLKRMRRALEDFREDARGAEVAVIYFAGHGVEIGGENRVLATDADSESVERLKDTSLPLEELRAAAASVAPVSILLIDACRDDPFGESAGEGRSARPVAGVVKAAVKPGLGRVGQAENAIFAFAAAPGATALDGADGHSPFAAALAKHLGVNGLEIRSALTLVQQEVYAETGGRQLPYVEGALPSLFFAAGAGKPDEREALLLAMAEVTDAVRADVERVAAEKSVPLAPLYGALIGANLNTLSQEDRRAKLAEAATAFTETRDRLRTFSSSDPEVMRLREAAGEALALGAFAEARTLLADAVRIDATSGDSLAANLLSRRLSEAATHEADAGVARAQLDYPGAIAAYEMAAALHERIEKEDLPDAARRDRTRILAELGDLHVLIGQTERALNTYLQMQIAAELRLAAEPSADAKRDLSVSYSRIGDESARNSDWQGALQAHEASLAIIQELVVQDPMNLDLKSDLSATLNRVGHLRAENNDGLSALEAFLDSHAIARYLVSQDPSNVNWQRNLSVSLNRIGDTLVTIGDDSRALQAYEDSLSIRQKLAAQDEGNTEWQRDVSVSLEFIGDLKERLRDIGGAQRNYTASLAIRQKLAEADPANANLQRDLIISHVKLSEVGSDGTSHLRAAVKIAEALEAKGVLAPVDGWMLDDLRERLAKSE